MGPAVRTSESGRVGWAPPTIHISYCGVCLVGNAHPTLAAYVGLFAVDTTADGPMGQLKTPDPLSLSPQKCMTIARDDQMKSQEQLRTESREQATEQRLPQRHWSAVGRLYDACLQNADQLLDEAELLLRNSHQARALTLALLAYEEIGKSQIVADYFNNMVSEKEFKEAFSRHEIKSAYNARQFRITSTNPFEARIVYSRMEAKKYSRYRMASLYVNCSEDYEPQLPSEAVTKENASAAIVAFRKKIGHIRTMAAITERIGSKSFTK